MRRATHWLLWCAVLVLPIAPSISAATDCAATPNAAVLQALGDAGSTEAQRDGFRVRDIVTDPLLHRAFVHVEQCGHPERPLVLLPFRAAHEAQVVTAAGSAPSSAVRSAEAAVPSGSLVSVAMGDAHMRIVMEGHLIKSAALGSEVDVQLASLGSAEAGTSAKCIRGRLTAADRVEVQP